VRKSYWMGISLSSQKSKEACKSWFAPLADEMTPYKAEILCDTETDREKKLRAFMTNAEGEKYKLERTLGKNNYTISAKRVVPA